MPSASLNLTDKVKSLYYLYFRLLTLSVTSPLFSSLSSVAWISWLIPTSFFFTASLLAAYNIFVFTGAVSGHLTNHKQIKVNFLDSRFLVTWNMRWRAPDQEVDKRGCGERLCKKIVKHVIGKRRNEVAMDRSRWKKRTKTGWWSGWWVHTVNVSSGTNSPG